MVARFPAGNRARGHLVSRDGRSGLDQPRGRTLLVRRRHAEQYAEGAHLGLFSQVPGYPYVHGKPVASCKKKLLDGWIEGLPDQEDHKLLGSLDDFWSNQKSKTAALALCCVPCTPTTLGNGPRRGGGKGRAVPAAAATIDRRVAGCLLPPVGIRRLVPKHHMPRREVSCALILTDARHPHIPSFTQVVQGDDSGAGYASPSDEYMDRTLPSTTRTHVRPPSTGLETCASRPSRLPLRQPHSSAGRTLCAERLGS